MSGEIERALGERIAAALPDVPVYDSQGRRFGSGLDVEGVLAAHPGWHRIDEDEHGAQRVECLGLKCRERFTLRYYGDAPEVYRAHVAAVLREQIAAWLTGEALRLDDADDSEDEFYYGEVAALVDAAVQITSSRKGGSVVSERTRWRCETCGDPTDEHPTDHCQRRVWLRVASTSEGE